MLAIALLVIAALSATAVALATYLSTETRLMRYHLARAQARAWARGGMIVAVQGLMLDATAGTKTYEPYDWHGDDWAAPTPYKNTKGVPPPPWVVELLDQKGKPDVEISIRMFDEERRLDLNTAKQEVLKTLLSGNGDAAEVIIDYRDTETTTGKYERVPTNDVAVVKNAAISTLDELWTLPLIRDEKAIRDILREETSVWTGGVVNLNTASAEVIKALIVPDHPNPTEITGLINTVIDRRPGANGQLRTDDDCKFVGNPMPLEPTICADRLDQTHLTTLTSKINSASSSVFRIESNVVMKQPSVQYGIETLVKRGSQQTGSPTGKGPQFQVLSWQER